MAWVHTFWTVHAGMDQMRLTRAGRNVQRAGALVFQDARKISECGFVRQIEVQRRDRNAI